MSARRRLPAGRFLLTSYSVVIYLFLYAPIAVLVLFSFNETRQTATWGGLTLRWYRELAQNEAVWNAAWTSLWVGTATTVAATVLGTAAALGMRSFSPRWRRLAIPVLLLPIVLPEIVLAVALLRVFSVADIELGFATIWFAHVVFSVSYVVVVVQARLAGMDDSLEEAAADLGARPAVVLFKVTLPQLWPAILAASLLVFTLSIDDYVVTSFVTGVGDTTLPLQIYAMFRRRITPEINAICTLLIVVTTTFIAGAGLLQARFSQTNTSRSPS